MAEYRTIRMTFWTDPYIEGLPPEGKLLYVYLFTSPHTNNLGMLEISRRKIAFETGLEVPKVDECVAQFERDGKAMTDGQKIWLTRFIKHQTMTSPKLTQALRKMLTAVASEPLRCALCERYPHIFDGSDTNPNQADTVSIPYTDTINTNPIPPGELEVGIGILKLEREGKDIPPLTPLTGGNAPAVDSGSVPEKPARVRRAAPREFPPELEAIWAACHPKMRECGRIDAVNCWTKLKKSGELPELPVILRALGKYHESKEGQDDPKWAHLSTWLNKGRWDTGEDIEGQTKVQRNAEREAADRKAELEEAKKKEAERAWTEAWAKVSEEVKEKWREYAIKNNSVLSTAREKGQTGLVELAARGAWRKHQENKIHAQRDGKAAA